MKVLIVDKHLGTRQVIAEIVRDYYKDPDPDAETNLEVCMAGDGGHAMNLIVGGAFNIIITSNQLIGYFGTNLLQAANLEDTPPYTLLHSTHPKGPRLIENDHREEIDLAACAAKFDFAWFAIKNPGFTYIKPFLKDIDILFATSPRGN